MAVTLMSGCSMFALSSRAPHSVRVRFSSLRSASPWFHHENMTCSNPSRLGGCTNVHFMTTGQALRVAQPRQEPLL